MVITHISGGLGNQIGFYAVGRYIAYRLDTELKLDVTGLKVSNEFLPHGSNQYRLNAFNIQANFATPEEVAHVKEHGITPTQFPDLEKIHGDIFIKGIWMLGSPWLADMINFFRSDFTLKNPLGSNVAAWEKKILDAECPVLMHFRHGDYAASVKYKGRWWSAIVPLDYYYTCLEILKQRYKNITVFVFSDNMQWIKQNLHLDVPTEYVDGAGITDDEEFFLMSLCKHYIISSSTFSFSAAALSQNPDKKIFRSQAADAPTVQQYLQLLKENKIAPLDSGRYLWVPFDFNNQPAITIRPIFSLLLVLNDNVTTLGETLRSILAQDYKYFELIIIDNASTDGSEQICRQAANASDKVTLIKLWNKIPDGAAYNKALDLAQGDYVLFLKGDDRLLKNALSEIHKANEYSRVDVVNSVNWLREDERGNISMANRKFVLEADAAFDGLQENLQRNFDRSTLFKILATDEDATSLASKVFKREFLADNNIRFDETDNATQMFITDAMLKADEMIFTPDLFYIAPRK